MAEINAELQNIIINAYKDIVENGVSLRKVSEDIGIDRKRLKKLMKDILSEEELNKFNTVLDKNNNRKKTGSRNKKSKALEGEIYIKAIEQLVTKGITPEIIEKIHTRCQERKQSKLTKDTLAIKLVDLLDYFETRNITIPDGDIGYISTEDVVEMILRNPRMMSCDLNNNIIPKCSIITDKNNNDISVANMKIKSNPGIFRKTIKNIREGK